MITESEQRRLRAIINLLRNSNDVKISIQGLELSLEELNKAGKLLKEV